MKTPTPVHPVDEILPLRQLASFGLQHALIPFPNRRPQA
ncbi:hypothetical protein C265_24015 [Cupriavidus sp. GA3-3]|nr:hypothetical protein C265_24015 [Cupriavidus sp. GA3-3]